MDRPDWEHAEYAGAIRRNFLGLFREVTRCEYPLRMPPRVAGELAHSRKLVVTHCMEHRGWPLDSPADAG